MLPAGLPEGTCSHILCPPHALAPYAVRSTSCGGQYPIERAVEPVSSARDVASQFVRGRCSHRLCQPCCPGTHVLAFAACLGCHASVCIAPLLRSSSRAFVFSKLPRKSRIRPTVCSKRTFSCYFWRKSNQNVGVGCAIEDAGNCQVLPHKLYSTKLLSPAAVHTPPHPHFGSFLASSLLMRRVKID